MRYPIVVIDSYGKTQKFVRIPLFDAYLMRKYGVTRKVAADPLYQQAWDLMADARHQENG